MKLSSLIFFALAMNGVLPVLGQDELSAKAVRALFTQSSKDDIGISDVWVACNKDNVYYRNDTIQLFNNINNMYHSGCCLHVEWKMDGRARMDLSRVQICHEPPFQSIAFKDQDLSIRVSDSKGSLRITLRSDGEDVDVFEVLELKDVPLWEGGDFAHRLTLRRIHATVNLR